jgi:putative hydrolase of HD superfamily
LFKLFDAAYMQRWNDKIRPVELIELDKQAHKMVIAYVLARFEEEDGNAVSWVKMIEAGIFELLQRIVITDLKPQIYYKIKTDTRKYRQLTEWVYRELHPVMSPLGKAFCKRYQEHFI